MPRAPFLLYEAVFAEAQLSRLIAILSISCLASLSAMSHASDDRICSAGVFVSPKQLAQARTRFVSEEFRLDADVLAQRVSRLLTLEPSPSTTKTASVFLEKGRRDFTAGIDLALYGVIGNDANVQRRAREKARQILMAWAKQTAYANQFDMQMPRDKKELPEFAAMGLWVAQVAIGAVHVYHLLIKLLRYAFG
jgi:hypothetical protein